MGLTRFPYMGEYPQTPDRPKPFAGRGDVEQKIYAFGMDGFIVPMMKRFAAEGALPHFERMSDPGVPS